jgi:hypothetical protein
MNASDHMSVQFKNDLASPGASTHESSAPDEIQGWSLTALRERLIKTGARLVKHARYAAFQMAEAALPREVFASILALTNLPRRPPAATVSA